MRRILLALALLIPAVVVPTQSSAAGSDRTYIVQFKDGFNQTAQAALAKNMGFSIDIQYKRVLNGFAARLTDAQAAGLSRNPNVANVEADQVMTLSGSITQDKPTWGLDRIDESSLPMDLKYSAFGDGSGVKVFVIDTGILSTHAQFEGRVVTGFSAINDGRGTTDCNGHGTHVAGTIAGKDYGVAKAATLVPVRVLDCNGSGQNSGVLAGLDYVTNNHTGTVVANMSLGGGFSSALNTAVQTMINSRVVLAVAAGNSNTDACTTSPASAPDAITVAATDKNDFRATFSNYGKCIDIFAPGVGITSAWIGSSNDVLNTISGTSMASPHVAGVAALMVERSSSSSVAAIVKSITDASVGDQVTDARSPINKLLQISSLPVPGSKPGAPFFTNVSTGKTRVSLNWEYSTNGVGGKFLLSQRLYIYVNNSPTSQSASTLQLNSTSVTVTNLSSSLSYRFCITGTNSFGEGVQGCTDTLTAASR